MLFRDGHGPLTMCQNPFNVKWLKKKKIWKASQNNGGELQKQMMDDLNENTHLQEGLELFAQEKQTAWESKDQERGFLGGSIVKNPPANAGDTGSIPGLERPHMPWSNSACAP